nr:hypothetical protein GCM10020185_64010 [Pseudomonas brassicacearum subsp. brassicacearum]
MVGPFIELPEPMKLSISTKLFIAVMASVLFVILSMGVANGWSFGNGFLDYLNEQALLRMKPVLPRLASAYEREGNWEFLRNQPDRWFELLRPEPGEKHHLPGTAAHVDVRPDRGCVSHRPARPTKAIGHGLLGDCRRRADAPDRGCRQNRRLAGSDAVPERDRSWR